MRPHIHQHSHLLLFGVGGVVLVVLLHGGVCGLSPGLVVGWLAGWLSGWLLVWVFVSAPPLGLCFPGGCLAVAPPSCHRSAVVSVPLLCCFCPPASLLALACAFSVLALFSCLPLALAAGLLGLGLGRLTVGCWCCLVALSGGSSSAVWLWGCGVFGPACSQPHVPPEAGRPWHNYGFG